MAKVLGKEPFGLLVDLGTGTGRILELFANHFERGIGIDLNRDMLAYARDKLERAGHAHCQVRQGDLFNIVLEDGVADAVVLHQVLHFLDDPARALGEAARILAPGGRLLIVDFAPHELEYLRDDFAHRRLGIEPAQLDQWLTDAGLSLAKHLALKPGRKSDSEKLTVSVWVAAKPATAGSKTARAATVLERTG